MRIHNLYEDANGDSHFRDIEVDWAEETPAGKMSKRLPATGIAFRETTTDYENGWHRAPRRQYGRTRADANPRLTNTQYCDIGIYSARLRLNAGSISRRIYAFHFF
jgi:hypothetical protein